MQVHDLNLSRRTVVPDETCSAVYDLFSADENIAGFAVVDGSRPVGLINRMEFILRLADKFGRPLFEKKPVTSLMQHDPLIVPSDLSVDELSRLIATAESAALMRGFIVTQADAFFGIGTGHALIAANVEQTEERLEEIREARDRAEIANEAKSQFLATMSHEIRTPMNGILGMANHLLGSEIDGHVRDQVETIHDSGKILMSLLNDILDLSKIEAGRLELEEIDFDLEALVESVSALWLPKAAAQGLTYSVEYGSTPVGILRSDPTRIRQILFNLLSNALKFTDKGDISIRIRQVPTTSGKVETRFEVRDTGTGISPGIQEKLFDKLTQADSTVSRRYGGSGLGLAVSRELAHALGGKIGVESMPGKGASFWFTIVSAGGDPAALREELFPTTDGCAVEPLRILVAEDNSVNQTVIRAMLERAGHRVDTVANGAEAITAATSQTYDVILMDVHMPEMDGVSATRRIRELSGPAGETPIIALTANAMKGDRETYLEAGMDDYVAKPIDPALITAALRRQCGEQVEAATGAVAAGGSKVPENADELAADLGGLLDDFDEIIG
tara:strand:+ start:3990 stop:5672 length:1683 start_codon:yes stop_codon:yes gene_type:complete